MWFPSDISYRNKRKRVFRNGRFQIRTNEKSYLR